MALATAPELATDPTFTLEQTVALERFAKLRVGGVFMEQGMGKTRVAVELANYRTDSLDAVLWVAPFSVLAAVETEVAKWGCTLPVRFLGYETLAQSDRTYLEVLAWCEDRKFLIIADESTFIKNGDSKRSKRMLQLRKHADYALALNGTPLTRDLWDLKRQMDFLSPKILATDDRAFRYKYFTMNKMIDDRGEERIWFETYEPNVAHLQSLMAPYIFEAKLQFGLPETTLVREHSASPEGHLAYAVVRDEFFKAWETGADEMALYEMLGKLGLIAATDPLKCESVAVWARYRHTLVFCQYREEQRLIAAALDGKCLVINGDTPAAERVSIFERSKTELVPLLLTYGVGSFGLNLQHFSECHFASLGFHYGRQQQAKSRIRRLGQESAIEYTEHVTDLGIDALIAKNLTKKGWLADLVRHAFDPRTIL
ncbi:SNF2-related protein [Arthrobacter sp. STN4]|uniref:SNF2-related protein n=1 Tax=Arthrobacter sp. STN4 TaxID=2923276 RepID=UPI002119CF60|nr:SNF2-related protein [Arthrobacter sp. STN4]MCQ9162984.1 SNF2-related protein [Arthrobacter sp. STN4]